MDKTEDLVPPKRSARVARILKKKGPLLVENTKKTLILKGHNTSNDISQVLRDFSSLLKPHAKSLNRKNEILPFEDASSIEFLTQKNDCSMFILGSHSKKRPNNLVMGRTYEGQILDQFEFGVDKFYSFHDIEGNKKAIGAKPFLLFLGDQWNSDADFIKYQNFFLDLFRGDRVQEINLKGLDHVISFSVIDGKIHIRGYFLKFKKSGTKVPKAELSAMGPFLDLTPRRTQKAPEDMWKIACKQPKILKPKKIKNVSNENVFQKEGSIHITKQDYDKIGGRLMPVLRDRRKRKSSESSEQGSKRSKTH